MNKRRILSLLALPLLLLLAGGNASKLQADIYPMLDEGCNRCIISALTVEYLPGGSVRTTTVETCICGLVGGSYIATWTCVAVKPPDGYITEECTFRSGYI